MIEYEVSPPAAVACVPQAARQGGTLFIVDFHRDGNSAEYRTFGWSAQEDTYVWSVYGSSGLRLPAPLEYGQLSVEIDFSICIYDDLLTTAVVRVFVNGHAVGSTRATGHIRLRFIIPAAFIEVGKSIDLRFEHPCFVRMDVTQLQNENRALGLCFYSLAIYHASLEPALDFLRPVPGRYAPIQLTPPNPSTIQPYTRSDPVTFRFGEPDKGFSYLESDWWLDEDGNMWSADRFSTVHFKPPSDPGDYLLQISLSVLYVRDLLPLQKITILLAGAVIGQFIMAIDTVLTIPVPSELLNGVETLKLTFVVPDGLSMKGYAGQSSPRFISFVLDFVSIIPVPVWSASVARLRGDDVDVLFPLSLQNKFLDDALPGLPAAVEETLGIPVTELLRHFESVGDNCFFGGLQRRAGVDVLGLLRFANTPARGLLTALADNFDLLRDASSLSVRVQDYELPEYLIFLDRYGMRWHTGAFRDVADPNEVLDAHSARLKYLRRKFCETLSRGRRIFVITRTDLREARRPIPDPNDFPYYRERREPYRLAEVLSIFFELNRDARNTLIYVTEPSDGRKSGTVELIAPGIMRGYVETLSISPELDDDAYAAWLRVVANAWLLDTGAANASFRTPPGAQPRVGLR